MQTSASPNKLCTSVFLNSTASAISNSFTQKWIDLINRQEELKRISSSPRQT